MNCINAIIANIPDAQCSCNEETNTIMHWVSPGEQPTQEQVDTWIVAYNAGEAGRKQIADAKTYLFETDYKMLPDYTVAPDGEPLDSVRTKRAAARELIRSLS